MQILKKKPSKLVIAITIYLIALLVLFCYVQIGKATPLLKVTVEKSDSGSTWIDLFGKPEHYRIYASGLKKKIEPYEEVEGVSYWSSFENSDSPIELMNDYSDPAEAAMIVNYMRNALDLVDFNRRSEISSCEIYICEKRYFFTISYHPLFGRGYNITIYEYYPEKNKLKKITTFRNRYINHLQLIKP